MKTISAKTPKPKKSMTAKELIQKHIHDPEHKITDEDLNSIKVGVEAEEEAEVDIYANKLEEEVKGHYEGAPNPYDVLGNES